MGVETMADKKLSEAKEHMSKAYNSLLVVLDSETWGNNEFTEEYIIKIEDAIILLSKIKRNL